MLDKEQSDEDFMEFDDLCTKISALGTAAVTMFSGYHSGNTLPCTLLQVQVMWTVHTTSSSKSWLEDILIRMENLIMCDRSVR